MATRAMMPRLAVGDRVVVNDSHPNRHSRGATGVVIAVVPERSYDWDSYSRVNGDYPLLADHYGRVQVDGEGRRGRWANHLDVVEES